MINFPAICVDNFYSDPDSVRNWALSLDYKPDPDGRWPGKRSEKLHLVDPTFFHNFCCKIFSLYFNLEIEDIEWIVHTQFQLIEPFDTVHNSIKNSGWIHYDYGGIFGGIIYLTPNIDLNCGTSIFEQTSVPDDKLSKEAKQNFYKHGHYENYEHILENHNRNFIETVNYKNIYNRFISFDGNTAHKANSFYSNLPRLTQVFFVNKCISKSPWPLNKHRKYL